METHSRELNQRCPLAGNAANSMTATHRYEPLWAALATRLSGLTTRTTVADP